MLLHRLLPAEAAKRLRGPYRRAENVFAAPQSSAR
jgi:hypothetical protein